MRAHRRGGPGRDPQHPPRHACTTCASCATRARPAPTTSTAPRRSCRSSPTRGSASSTRSLKGKEEEILEVVSAVADSRAALRRDHHGRQRALGPASAACRSPRATSAGADAVKARLRDAVDLGIRELTVYSFSTENWSRPHEEVAGADGACSPSASSRETPELHERGRAHALHRPPRGRRAGARRADGAGPRSTTAANDRITLFVAFNYGGRAEILDAARALRGRRRGGVPRATSTRPTCTTPI